MRFLVISQVFWPDTASTAQHLADLTSQLVEHGHEVTVYCSRYAYENNKLVFPVHEIHNKIKIRRIRNSGFGKRYLAGRLADFGSFNLLLFFKLLRIKKKSFDAIIGMTSPPLVSLLGVFISGVKKMKFFYWVMDLQPELAIASGLIRKNSLSARMLESIGNYIIRKADSIFVLDKYMHQYLIQRGAGSNHIHVVPVWPILDDIYTGERNENPFRIENGFGDRIVIMYSGNHSYVHPLDTLLAAALALKDDPDFLFVFVGEGVRKKDVTRFKEVQGLKNIVQLSYQPRNNIHNSLGSSDLQVVIMGDQQVGFTHPNKIYGAMFIGKPILYIGPSPSHVTDILDELEGNIIVNHNQESLLVEKLMTFKRIGEALARHIGNKNRMKASKDFDPRKLKSEMVRILTSLPLLVFLLYI
ncbi:MAG: glycosyltransferase family 4 protein [Bacteroidota bacterium]|nr:glycosyltransferase family 4 protein [Bacteroidota bacterium]MDP4252151.1 glycosyltransferase family 4 protein [Bacteroidota bacterium]